MLEKIKQRKYPLILMSGHMCTDIYQGALPALLPFLILEKGLSYTAAGGLVLACSSLSSAVQPIFGYLADKKSSPVLMSIGVMIAGIGFSMIGMFQSYWAMFFSVMFSGLGIALFHPEGGRMIHCVSKENKGEAYGIFSLGGKAGFALGPVLIALTIPFLGLKGTLLFLIPPVIMVWVLLSCNKELTAMSHHEKKERMERIEKSGERQKDDWKGFSFITGSILGNSVIYYGLLTFIPIFWVDVLMQSQVSGSTQLTLFSVVSAIAVYFGGKQADVRGFKKIILIGNFAAVPFLFFIAGSNQVLVTTLLLVCLGFFLNLGHSPSVSLGQQLLPNHVGIASGITLGLSVSAGGLAAPLLGWIGEQQSLIYVFILLGMVGAVVALISTWIPGKVNREEDAGHMLAPNPEQTNEQ